MTARCDIKWRSRKHVANEAARMPSRRCGKRRWRRLPGWCSPRGKGAAAGDRGDEEGRQCRPSFAFPVCPPLSPGARRMASLLQRVDLRLAGGLFAPQVDDLKRPCAHGSGASRHLPRTSLFRAPDSLRSISDRATRTGDRSATRSAGRCEDRCILSTRGPLAQLGERRLCTAEVSGSNPLRSTSQSTLVCRDFAIL